MLFGVVENGWDKARKNESELWNEKVEPKRIMNRDGKRVTKDTQGIVDQFWLWYSQNKGASKIRK